MIKSKYQQKGGVDYKKISCSTFLVSFRNVMFFHFSTITKNFIIKLASRNYGICYLDNILSSIVDDFNCFICWNI